MKLETRGRSKFTPDPSISANDIKQFLLKKIEDEHQKYKYDNSSSSIDEDVKYKLDKLNVISLFSGAGGLDLGVELAGLDIPLGQDYVNSIIKDKSAFEKNRHLGLFNTVYSNDIFPEAIESYKRNIGENVFLHKEDIRRVSQFPKAEIILGGFPCPGFSEAGPRLLDDERNFLYLHFIRAILQVQPKFFIAENVKGMLTLGKGAVFQQIVEDFSAAGYKIYHKLLNSRDFGVPQIRERVFLVGVRDDINFKYIFPTPTHGIHENLKPFVTLKEAIGDLEINPGPYFKGTYSPIYMSRNRKKAWEDQSFTIQASGRQAPLHPSGRSMKKMGPDEWVFPDGEENNRRLSVKEIARIQTFPDWFEFYSGQNSLISEAGQLNKIYKQIGNAVPIELARAVAKPLAEFLYR